LGAFQVADDMRWKVRSQHQKKFGDIDWHPWFAWHPIVIAGQWVWGERIERRLVHHIGSEVKGVSLYSATGWWQYKQGGST